MFHATEVFLLVFKLRNLIYVWQHISFTEKETFAHKTSSIQSLFIGTISDARLDYHQMLCTFCQKRMPSIQLVCLAENNEDQDHSVYCIEEVGDLDALTPSLLPSEHQSNKENQ